MISSDNDSTRIRRVAAEAAPFNIVPPANSIRPGDDVRRIDWNVTARMDTPFVRHTHAEREMNIMIVMDMSRSMQLGSAGYSKKEALTFITGSIFSGLVSRASAGISSKM